MADSAPTDPVPAGVATTAEADARKRKRQEKKFEKIARRKGTHLPATLCIAPESAKGIKLRCGGVHVHTLAPPRSAP